MSPLFAVKVISKSCVIVTVSFVHPNQISRLTLRKYPLGTKFEQTRATDDLIRDCECSGDDKSRLISCQLTRYEGVKSHSILKVWLFPSSYVQSYLHSFYLPNKFNSHQDKLYIDFHDHFPRNDYLSKTSMSLQFGTLVTPFRRLISVKF